jgi:outer membrane protein OmpA-like peptidoglycan-associated protein
MKITVVAALLSALTNGRWAAAQSRAFDLDAVVPAITGGDFLATEGAGTITPWSSRVGVSYRYLDRPLTVDQGGRREALVTTRSVLEISGAVQLGRWAGVAVALPFLAETSGSDVESGAALGDLRLVPRVELLRARGVGLALLGGLRLPTGDTSRFLGEGMVVFEPRLAFQADLARRIVRLGVNVGVRVREARRYGDLEVGHQGYASLALTVAPSRYVDGTIELHGTTALSSRFGEGQTSPVEMIGGIGGGAKGLRVGAAAGIGIVDGFGAPRVRAFATLEYRIPPPARAETAAAAPPTPARPAPPAPPPPSDSEKEELAALPSRDDDDDVPMQLPDERDVRFVGGRVELADPIFFDLNRKRIRSRFHGELVELARALARRPAITHVWIEGHADATGPAKFNLALSRARAAAVAAFLVAHGVDGARLEPVGFGEARPLVPSPAGVVNPRNRRVQFFVDVERREERLEATGVALRQGGAK